MKKVPISFCLRFWSRLFLLQMFLVSVAPANNDQSVVWLLHRMCRDQRTHGLDIVVVKLFLEVQQLPLPQEGEIGGVAEHPPRVRHNHNCLKYTHVMASILSYCRKRRFGVQKSSIKPLLHVRPRSSTKYIVLQIYHTTVLVQLKTKAAIFPMQAMFSEDFSQIK